MRPPLRWLSHKEVAGSETHEWHSLSSPSQDAEKSRRFVLQDACQRTYGLEQITVAVRGDLEALGHGLSTREEEFQQHLPQAWKGDGRRRRPPAQLIRQFLLLEEHLDVVQPRDAGDRVAHGLQIQAGLAVRQDELPDAVREVRVPGLAVVHAADLGFGGGLDAGLGRVTERGDELVEDGLVEAVVVAESRILS